MKVEERSRVEEVQQDVVVMKGQWVEIVDLERVVSDENVRVHKQN